MDNVLKVFLNDTLMESMPHESIIVYMVMRSDIELNSTVTTKFAKRKGLLISGCSVQSLALRLKIPIFTIERRIKELVRKNWVKLCKFNGETLYQLGTTDTDTFETDWFLKDEAPVVVESNGAVKSQIKQLIAETKARQRDRKKIRVSKETRRDVARKTVAGLLGDEKPTKRLFKLYKELYCKKYGDLIISSDRLSYERALGKVYGQLNHLLKYCDQDVILSLNVVKFLFENWIKIKSLLEWEGEINFDLLGTAKLAKKIKRWSLSGLPDTKKVDVGKRYDKDAAKISPDEGF